MVEVMFLFVLCPSPAQGATVFLTVGGASYGSPLAAD